MERPAGTSRALLPTGIGSATPPPFAQSLGFSLDEIRRIMSLRGQGRETCRSVISIAEATLAETDTKLKELRKFKDTLATNLTQWKRKRRGPIAAEFCALIEAAG